MASDGNDRPKLPPESTGKGKGKSRGDSEEASGSLLKGIMQSARSSVTPANLSSLMAGNGKSVGLPSSAVTASQDFNDAQKAYSVDLPTQMRDQQTESFRQIAPQSRNQEEEAYRQFAEMGSSRLDLGIHEALRSASPVYVGPYSSAQSLDAALHDQVRASSSYWNGMEEAWTSHSSAGNGEQSTDMHDTGYHEAWTRNIPRMPTARLNDMQRGADIDQLLQTVNLSDQPSPVTLLAHSNGQFVDIMGILDEEERNEEYAAPDTGMSEEQAELHRALHDVQNSEDRADEKIRPPDDDASARLGVYAATPEEALRAIWDGPAEGERASSVVRDSLTPGQNLSRKIRELLMRGSYVDDVYGIPPQLQKTIVIAEEQETEENKDRRAKAIARLDALYKHLGATSSTEASINDFVRNW